jgi:hypothetical protein
VIATLGRLPAARIARSPRLWCSVGGWCALTLIFAAFARHDGWAHGADRVLGSVYGALALPFIGYAVARATFAGRSMVASTAPLVAFGAAPWRGALASICVATLATALVGASLAATVALIAHGSADPPLGRDAIASAYAGGLGGAAYAAWFALGTTVGRRGGGRLVFLAADWLLGAGNTTAALVTPRAHLRNLLGGAAPLSISERSSATLMVALVVVYTLLAARGGKRR